MKGLSTLIDNVVVDDKGNRVGRIDELILDCHSGRIEYVIVNISDQSRMRLLWADLNPVGEGFVLMKGKRNL